MTNLEDLLRFSAALDQLKAQQEYSEPPCRVTLAENYRKSIRNVVGESKLIGSFGGMELRVSDAIPLGMGMFEWPDGSAVIWPLNGGFPCKTKRSDDEEDFGFSFIGSLPDILR